MDAAEHLWRDITTCEILTAGGSKTPKTPATYQPVKCFLEQSTVSVPFPKHVMKPPMRVDVSRCTAARLLLAMCEMTMFSSIKTGPLLG
jgi:hypothetical protein